MALGPWRSERDREILRVKMNLTSDEGDVTVLLVVGGGDDAKL